MSGARTRTSPPRTSTQLCPNWASLCPLSWAAAMYTSSAVLADGRVDWATVGVILSVLRERLKDAFA